MSAREPGADQATRDAIAAQPEAPPSGAERQAYVRALARLIFAERQEQERLSQLRKVSR